MSASEARPCTEQRLSLLRAGFAPLPCSGKIPAMEKWQEKHVTNDAEIRLWDKVFPFSANTGILTRLTPTIDIDITLLEAAEAVEGLARDRFEEEGTFLIRIGKPPKRAVLLRTDRPFSKIVVNLTAPNGAEDKIELLCDGQQLVAFGIHPDTRRPYRWHGGEPGAVKLSDLPYIDQDTARAFVEDAVELLEKEYGYTRPAKRTKAKGGATGRANGFDHRGAHDWVDLIDNIKAGREIHDSIVTLAAKVMAAGMGPGAAVNMLRALLEASEAPRDDRWEKRYAEIPAAVESGKLKFGQAEQEKKAADVEVYDAGDDAEMPPPRGWLMALQFCRRFLSSLLAPGGVGKTALRMLQFIALATGRNLTGQHVFGRYRVLLLSFEDDRDELRRRMAAARIHHRIDRGELKGWLFYAVPRGMKLAEMQNGSRQIGMLEKWLRKKIAEMKPDIIGLDPFVKLHALEENDNGQMDFVCDLLTQLAMEFDIAVDVPHHTRKGTVTPGDAETGRGASGVKDAGRLVCTLTVMSPEEAETFGIKEEQRPAYVRLDPAKVNIMPKAQHATWFRLVGVPLRNGTDEYPNGDEVQTVEPWAPPDTWANLSVAALNKALDEIDKGMPNGQRYSSAGSAKERAAWRVAQNHCPDKTEPQCRKIIKTWLLNGVLYEEEYDDPIHRKPRMGLRVNSAKRPG
jgi:hypothetical protein